MNFTQQACQALSDAMQLELKLTSPPTVVYANPSEVADYPSVAVWPEKHETTWTQDDEVGVDENDELLLGGRASVRNPAGAAMLDDLVSHLSIVGRSTCSGRIFVGCRLPPKREAIQGLITRMFERDAMTPGIIEVVVPRPRVGPHVLPWSWNASFRLGRSSWEDEPAFSERLWGYLSFDMDVSMLVDRSDPLITQLLLAEASGTAQGASSSVDVADALASATNYQITEDDVLRFTE